MWPKGALPRLRRSPFEPPFGAESSAFHIVPGPVFGPVSGPVARGFGLEMRPKTAPPSPHFGTESPFATGSKTGPNTGMRPKTGPAIWPKCRAGGSKGPRFRAGSRTSGDVGVTAHRQDVCGAREICHSAAPKKTRSIVGFRWSSPRRGALRRGQMHAGRNPSSLVAQRPGAGKLLTELVLPRRLHQKSARQSNYKAISRHQFRPERALKAM